MRKQYCISRWPVFIFLIALGLWSGASLRAQPQATAAPGGQYKVMVVEGLVEIARAGSQTFDAIQINSWLFIGDRVRIGPNGKLTIQRLDNSVYRFDKKTEFVILAPRSTASTSPAMQVLSGILYFLHRGKPELLEVLARRATAAVRGTEFELRVDETDTMVVTVIDGVVDLSNEVDRVAVQSGQQGIAEPGKAPVVRAAIDAVNIIQWTLYYPGILDVDEIPLTADERTALRSSIDAYRAGDLLRAVSEYPAGREPGSDAERVYRAGLFVAVGQIADAENLLRKMRIEAGGEGNVNWRLVGALRNVIAAVKLKPTETKVAPELASEWLAESYQLQSRADLEGGLWAARSAVSKSPNFGFGWARVAELEFSFGRIDAATEAIQKSLQLAPRNAQAMALNGFLFAARNKLDSARGAFEEAMAVDGRLANAWLGRGLVRIRQGDRVGGREDLLTAAAMEPQRAFLRSYLGKAWADAGEKKLAEHELELAEQFDPRDPTAWLYSALLKAQYNRINEAIRDLEHAQDLSTNRAVYRSQFLIDQDRAVRSVNLARAYADANMADVAVREAGRAVALDYGNYSAHLFLANSFEAERRENLSNPRFEGPSSSEYFISSLLGPANGRLLAQPVSQLEYGGLFEKDRLGVIANTEYFSRGAWRHSSAQYGTIDGFSYSIEPEYRSENGERANQDYEIRQLEAKFKYDLTPSDSFFLRYVDYEAEGGDTLQHFAESEVRKSVRFRVVERPSIIAGYHHEWTPQNHTLVAIGGVHDKLNESLPTTTVLGLDTTAPGIGPVTAGVENGSSVDAYAAELQQIVAIGRHTVIAGASGLYSEQDVRLTVSNPRGDFAPLLGIYEPVSDQQIKVSSHAEEIYAYDYVQLFDSLKIVAGLSYTFEELPVNTTSAPVSTETEDRDHLSPKGGIIWNFSDSQHLRASYAQSLTGIGAGEIASVRLEPTHIAGMVQSFREPVPFSIVGQLTGAELEVTELIWEGRFGDTFLSIGGQRLAVERHQRLGLFVADIDYTLPPTPALIREDVKFREYAVEASIHQLLGKEWSFGAEYRGSYAQLLRRFPEYIGQAYSLDEDTDWRGWLHTLTLSALYRHHLELFVRSDATLFIQEREREGASLEGDKFWQANIIGGYRFARQRAELAVGVLNLLDRDYRLDPINHYSDLPRSRTFYMRVLLDF